MSELTDAEAAFIRARDTYNVAHVNFATARTNYDAAVEAYDKARIADRANTKEGDLPDIGWIEWLGTGNRKEFLLELDRWKATAEHDEFLRQGNILPGVKRLPDTKEGDR